MKVNLASRGIFVSVFDMRRRQKCPESRCWNSKQNKIQFLCFFFQKFWIFC